jgi:energy-coupling factor transporter ATP-binding protein EcfA2
MINIEVKGFQSAEDVKFVIDGFTAIVGRSNIGKSALVRALKCALTNAEGVSFVRHGPECARTLRGAKTCKCFASVHIVTEGFDLLWEKGDSVYRYIFNKSEYDHPGKGLPEFLSDNGLAPVRLGDGSGCIQISNQFYPIFLLDQSGGVVAETISDVSKLTRINKATKLVEKDRRDLQATKKVREKDFDNLRLRLCFYEGLDVELQKVVNVEGQFKAIEDSEGRLEAIKGYISKVTNLGLKVRGLTSVASVVIPDTEYLGQLGPKFETLSRLTGEYDYRLSDVSNLEWVENLEDINSTLVFELGVRLKQVSEFITEYEHRLSDVSDLEWVEGLDVPDITSVSESGSSLRKVSEFTTEYTRRQSNVAALSWVDTLDPLVPDISGVEGKHTKLLCLDSRVSSLRAIKIKFDSLGKVIKTEIPESEPLQTLQDRLSTLSKFVALFQALQTSVGEFESDLSQVELEESALDVEIQTLGVCPTCTKPLALDHLHA